MPDKKPPPPGEPPSAGLSQNTRAIIGLGVCLLALVALILWLSFGPKDAAVPRNPSAIHNPDATPDRPIPDRIPLTDDTRQQRQAALDSIPPAPGSSAISPDVKRSGTPRSATPDSSISALPAPRRIAGNSAVVAPPSVAPVLISGSGAATPLERAMHPSAAPPSGITPATQPSTYPSSLKPGTYAHAVELELQRRFIMSMCTDLQGNLWVATEGGGVQRFVPSTGSGQADQYNQWTQFTTKDGLGDDDCYAIACDQEGRIWVGHLNHGVSVFNGSRWQNYEVVGGLSRPDTLSGPLGERIFHITICPLDGDVWICSSCGLARYSISHDTWSYITRADGLVSDQANSLAFDAEGNIYVATQCDGIAMANRADDYKTWRQVTGPDEEPQAPLGEGLPTNLMNDILVTRDGTVVAATDVGLTWSKDQGKTWRYMRGLDWAEKVRRSAAGAPQGWIEPAGAVLAEDYCTCLAEDSAGLLYLGYREHGFQKLRLSADGGIAALGGVADGFVKTFSNSRPFICGTYGLGILGNMTDTVKDRQASETAGFSARLPIGAPSLTIEELQKLHQRLHANAAQEGGGSNVFYLGEDWATGGDWMGRYGKSAATLLGAGSGGNHDVYWAHVYDIDAEIGPIHAPGDELRYWIHWLTTDNPRSLYDPVIGARRQAEIDDHGEVYNRYADGPDIWMKIKVPDGVQRISLYFLNKDGEEGNNRFRDFPVEIHLATHDSPTLARFRVNEFFGGVYKQFIVNGPALYQVRIARNHSLNAICTGGFADRLTGTMTNSEKNPKPWMNNMRYDPPLPATQPTERAGSAAAQIAESWLAINSEGIEFSDTASRHRRQILTYRAAMAANVNGLTLTAWRWTVPLWVEGDRTEFVQRLDAIWEREKKRQEDSERASPSRTLHN